jgi:hypothetical protein
MKLFTIHDNPLRFFPLFVSEWSGLQELWVTDVHQLPPFLINSTPAAIFTSADETTIQGEAAILRKRAQNLVTKFADLVTQSKSKLRWQKVQLTVAETSQSSLSMKQQHIAKMKEERIYFDSDDIVLYHHSLTSGIRLHLNCEFFLDTSPRTKIFHQFLTLGTSLGGSVMTKEVGILPLNVVTGDADKFIMTVELRKTGTTDLLGLGECFIEILELRTLEGNDFVKKSIRLMGGYPLSTVADTNMCIRIQKKSEEKTEEQSADDWNPDDFD